MSGIAGIVNLDGAPVSRALLDRMAEFLAYRGPDRTEVWARGQVGLVHTMLRTTPESSGERQPASLDGEVWISADARLDGRETLLGALRDGGCRCEQDATEPELLLHAYRLWSEQCVEYLLGDFAFAIWDGRARRLFCARDHFGVKPFFYAEGNGALIFSNTIDAPRLHPGVSEELYEPAIADFLILGYGHDVERTAIAAVRRLAAGHVLIADDGGVRTRRYWSLPVDPPTVFRHAGDYVERFLELFGRAVGDRLRSNRVAVLMSGGMDSSSVAAMAKRLLERRGGAYELSAHTGIYERLIPYEEGRYASEAAQALGIRWHGFPLDDQELLGLWNQPEFRRAEPEKVPVFPWKLADMLGKPAAGTVVVTGQGSDGLFSSLRKRHCRERLRQGQWGQVAREVGEYLLAEGRLRRLYLRGHLLRGFGQGTPTRPFPAWLNPELDRRLHLRSRYEQYEVAAVGITAPGGAVRPEGWEIMSLPVWPCLFEEYEPEHTGAAVEVRHPFFDLRLVRYVLSLPALPWCSDKELLRRSMRGLLPDEVRLRRKQPVPADHMLAHFRQSKKPWLGNFEAEKGLEKYVDVGLAMEYLQDLREWNLVVHLRPICLNYWLKWESAFAYNLRREKTNV
jgi:asparagine synthase (glutamine-hydrolysing)